MFVSDTIDVRFADLIRANPGSLGGKNIFTFKVLQNCTYRINVSCLVGLAQYLSNWNSKLSQ